MFVSKRKHNQIVQTLEAKATAQRGEIERLRDVASELEGEAWVVAQICREAKGTTVGKKRILEALGYEV